MHLIIQIPCYNEEKTLPLVLKSIPKKIPGVTKLETMIIDDGSKDKTVAVAKKLGVTHIIRHAGNQGLAASFSDGINESLKLGADIIVNTDGDNQYPQQDIPKLIKPILDGKAEIVIGNRQTHKIKHFSSSKKFLQWFGSAVVRTFSQTNVPDAVSGFRAYSREAALHMNIVTDFSYVIETIIQARQKRLAITSVDVTTNPPTRESRLFKSSLTHMRRSAEAVLRVYTMYQPLKIFVAVGIYLLSAGLGLTGRFVYFFLIGEGSGHLQSLIFAAVLLLAGFQVVMTGVVADLIGINRRLNEAVLRRVKGLELARYEKNISSPRKKKRRVAQQVRRRSSYQEEQDRIRPAFQ
jgi:glycosyltransferase involved in cell wall biosynthesis